MPRSKGQTGQACDMVGSLENATAALVRTELIMRVTRLRIEQATSRSGLHNLLNPALSELDEMTQSMRTARLEVAQALTQLSGE